MKTIAIVTATRAEYGLLYPVIIRLRELETENFKAELIVTGTHLSQDFGNTIEEIEKDKIRIDYRIHIPVKTESDFDISMNQSKTLSEFALHFSNHHYDGVVLLGDRYEILMVAIAAANRKIPIFHLYGGDTTEGAVDEFIRHSLTKMSFVHFPTNEISRRRVIQLGEDPSRVFNFGATGIDNIINMKKYSKGEALDSIGLCDCTYALCTYHPVTLAESDIEKEIMGFLDALSEFPNIEFIITKANADKGGGQINTILDREETRRSNIHVYASLGLKRYLSLMSHAVAVIGNSSSGILEAPAFGIPTVNIGERQNGRLQSRSIINCGSSKEDIIDAIGKAIRSDMKYTIKDNPYGDGNAGYKIAKKIFEVIHTDIDLMKKFYDIDWV